MRELYLRHILNLPEKELSLDRLGFYVEEAHWYYQDYIIDRNPELQSLKEKQFTKLFFQYNPHLLRDRTYSDFLRAYSDYRAAILVCGGILLNPRMDKAVLVSAYNEHRPNRHNNKFKFPKGKIDQGESEISCASREVFEEVGYSIEDKINERDKIVIKNHRNMKKETYYIVPDVPENTQFQTHTVKEIGAIEWFRISDIRNQGNSSSRFPGVYPIIEQLVPWIEQRRPQQAHFEEIQEIQIEIVPPESKPQILKKNRIMGILSRLLSQKT